MVVDAQGWRLSEEYIPKEEKIELLRAISLFTLGGPHVVLLVIPLLDFTETEWRTVERRMGILTPTVWRHTMVLFTCGDWLRRRGRTVEDHIQSGGPALHRLMEKCRYRYHVFDNKAAVVGKQERRQQGMKTSLKPQEVTWQKKTVKAVGRKTTGGETNSSKDSEQEQVRELLIKVENMLQENGGWHFSLHMYQRLEEEWVRREQELRSRLAIEMDVGGVRGKQKTAKTNRELEQRLEVEEEKEFSLRTSQENKGKCVERKIDRWEDEEERAKVELNIEEEGSDTSTGTKAGMKTPCCPIGGQRLAFSPIRGLA